jgi:hypothetical protein
MKSYKMRIDPIPLVVLFALFSLGIGAGLVAGLIEQILK